MNVGCASILLYLCVLLFITPSPTSQFSATDKLFSGDKSPASKDFTLDDVNPKLREEVKRTIERLHEVTFTLVHPGEDDDTTPNMAEMETQVTCHDLNEWNNSIIFKLVFTNKVYLQGSYSRSIL